MTLIGGHDEPEKRVKIICQDDEVRAGFVRPKSVYGELVDRKVVSFEDLCNINDFRVNVEVRFVTKEQD